MQLTGINLFAEVNEVTLYISLAITLSIFGAVEMIKASKLAKTPLIKDYVNSIEGKSLSKFIPPSRDIKYLKEQIESTYPDRNYFGMTIRQAITYAIDSKKRGMKDDAVQRIVTIDSMSGRGFELFIRDFFNKQGYRTRLTKQSGDQGVDLILYKDDRKIAVQCKRYHQNNRVGNKAIQEVRTGAIYYGCNECWVITSSFFTTQAIDLASKVGVVLIDRTSLHRLIGGELII